MYSPAFLCLPNHKIFRQCYAFESKGKGKVFPLQARCGPEGG